MALHTKRVLVTGASAGIGRATARLLVEAGAHVAACARRGDALESLRTEVEGSPGKLYTHVCDVSKADSVINFVESSREQLGGFDTLLNNAGLLGPRVGVASYPVEDFQAVLDVNVFGLFLMTRTCLPELTSGGMGLVINVSSGLGRFGVADSSAYCASKFAVEGFTQSLADEYPKEELVAVTLSPGMVATDMLRNYLGEEDVSQYLDPTDVANGILNIIDSAEPGWTGRALDIESYLRK
ncbi:MAG: oxidoreductase [Myxococcales bacterium]|nr:oxidoreductase [Myxococcales bacterium]